MNNPTNIIWIMADDLSWAEDGSIHITGNAGEMFRVPPGASDVEPLQAGRLGRFRSYSHFLPAGNALLYVAWTRPDYWDSSRVVVEPLGGEEQALSHHEHITNLA